MGSMTDETEDDEDNRAGVFDVLIKAGADLSAVNSAIHSAAASRSERRLVRLIAAGANFDASHANGTVPSHVAAANGNERMMAVLIEAGANTDAIDDDRCTPCHIGAANRNERVLALLIEAGVDLNAADYRGVTPLLFLAEPLLSSCRRRERRTTACCFGSFSGSTILSLIFQMLFVWLGTC